MAAWLEAGHVRHYGRARDGAARADVIARVEEIVRERTWGGSADLAPVIDRCMALAEDAGNLGTAAGMVAARGLLAEAARLKGLLPAAAASLERRPVLTDDEWLAKYAPPQA